MAEYDLGFAEKMAEAADLLDEKNHWRCDARRVVVYLCRVSMEISLKALLEKAGVAPRSIRKRNHDLRGLLSDLDSCEVLEHTAGLRERWISAGTVREECIDYGFIKLPIGEYIAADSPEVSEYPNQIRYGSLVIDFTPPLLIGSARLLLNWAQAHWSSIRVKQ